MTTIRMCACALALFALSTVHAGEVRHGEGAVNGLGPNRVMQIANIKVLKTKTGMDTAQITIDLGANKYTGLRDPRLTTERPVIVLNIAGVYTFTGQADKKGKIHSPNFEGHLIMNGLGMTFNLRKESLANLLAVLRKEPGETHAHVTITVTDDHPPMAENMTRKERAAAEATPRHEGVLYEGTFDLDTWETTRDITGKS